MGNRQGASLCRRLGMRSDILYSFSSDRFYSLYEYIYDTFQRTQLLTVPYAMYS